MINSKRRIRRVWRTLIYLMFINYIYKSNTHALIIISTHLFSLYQHITWLDSVRVDDCFIVSFKANLAIRLFWNIHVNYHCQLHNTHSNLWVALINLFDVPCFQTCSLNLVLMWQYKNDSCNAIYQVKQFRPIYIAKLMDHVTFI